MEKTPVQGKVSILALEHVSNMRESQKPLGDFLKQLGNIRDETLSLVLQHSNNTQQRIGEKLIAAKLISSHTLYRALAAQRDMPFVNLFKVPPQKALLSNLLIDEYALHHAVPWKKDNDLITIACTTPTEDTQRWAEKRYGKNVRFVMTAPRDIYHAIEINFDRHLEKEARFALVRDLPLVSARSGTTTAQRFTALALFFLLTFSVALTPTTSLTVILLIINLFYASHLAFKAFLFTRSIKQLFLRNTPEPPPLSNHLLPTYTLLIPMYDEAPSIPHLLNALEDIDYPIDKLDIKLILEESDKATFEAIKKHQPLPHYHVIKVPAQGNLRTKPRACNYALQFARGELITIYDAEDRPDPKQLRRVAALFATQSKEIACVQCKLNFYNRNEHWLARLFSIEYSQLFDTYLPALQSLNMPIPLGGTSNHLHVSRLKSVGAWDPFNVTEDADLGVRLALLGKHTVVLNSLTMEEAPITIKAWLNQRSRWIKGHMQTWMVYMRQPRKLYHAIGGHGFLGFQLFVGTPSLVYLTAPIMWCIGLFWALGIIPDGLIPAWMLILNLLILVTAFAGHIWQALITIRLQGWDGMTKAAIAYPLYWFLHSAASFKALYQFIFRPHYWEKTSHGASKFTNFRW